MSNDVIIEASDEAHGRRRWRLWALSLIAVAALVFLGVCQPWAKLTTSTLCVPTSQNKTANLTDGERRAEHATHPWSVPLSIAANPSGLKSPAEPLQQSQPPLFYQNSGAWAPNEYAHTRDLVGGFSCGDRIEQCGCAMTSLANLASLFGIVSTPAAELPEQPLNPGSFNTWLNRNARYQQNQGWISDGYYLGLVIWSDIAPFTQQLRKAHPERNTPVLSYRGAGTGSAAEIRAELEAKRPVVLEVPGHFIAAIGIDAATNDIILQDPFYQDRRLLSKYPKPILSSRLFEVGSGGKSTPAMLVMAPPDVRIQVRDANGNLTGTLERGPASDVADAAPRGIPDSTFDFESAWSDPNCENIAPRPGAGASQLYIRNPAPGLTVQILDPGKTGACVAVYRYDDSGNVTVERICDRGGQELFTRSLTPSENVAGPTSTPTPPPAPTPGPADEGAGGGGGGPTPTPTPRPATVTPTVTATAAPSTVTPTPVAVPVPPAAAPGLTVSTPSCTPPSPKVGERLRCSVTTTTPGAVLVSWSAPGGEPSDGTGTTFETSFSSPGSKRIVATAAGVAGSATADVTLTIPDPPSVSVSGCEGTFNVGQSFTCTASSTAADAISWKAEGGAPASGTGSTFTTSFPSTGEKTIVLNAVGPGGTITREFRVTIVSIDLPPSGSPSLTIPAQALSDGRVEVPYSQPVTAVYGAGALTWTVSSGALPAGLDIVPSSGVISGTPTTSGTATFTLQVRDSATPPQTASREFSLTIRPRARVSADVLTTASPCVPFAPATSKGDGVFDNCDLVSGDLRNLRADPTNPVQFPVQFRFAVFADAVPDGLFDRAGVDNTVGNADDECAPEFRGLSVHVTTNLGSLSATSAVTTLDLTTDDNCLAGPVTFRGTDLGGTATVTAAVTAPAPATASVSLDVTPKLVVETSSPLPDGFVGTSYSLPLTSSGGRPAVTWGVTAGALPAGLTLSSSGVLSGTPTAAGPTSFTVSATDGAPAPQVASKAFTLRIRPPALITADIASRDVDAGCRRGAGDGTFDSCDVVSGTIPVLSDGSKLIQFQVALFEDVNGDGRVQLPGECTTDRQGVSVTVTTNLGTLTLAPPNTRSLLVTTGADCLTPPIPFRGDGAAGTATIRSTASQPAAAAMAFDLPVVAMLAIPPQTLPDAFVGVPYSATLFASGGTSPLAWTVASGSLPPPLALQASTGTIGGTPNSPGTYPFTIRTTDSSTPAPQAATREFTITVRSRPMITSDIARSTPGDGGLNCLEGLSGDGRFDDCDLSVGHLNNVLVDGTTQIELRFALFDDLDGNGLVSAPECTQNRRGVSVVLTTNLGTFSPTSVGVRTTTVATDASCLTPPIVFRGDGIPGRAAITATAGAPTTVSATVNVEVVLPLQITSFHIICYAPTYSPTATTPPLVLTLLAAGGTAPYQWYIYTIGGTAPPFPIVSLSPSGTLSIQGQAGGDFRVEVAVQDSAGRVAYKVFDVLLYPCVTR